MFVKEPISPYDAEDPGAKVILHRIWFSQLQKRMLGDKGWCYLTEAQQKVLNKFIGKKISHLPAGWDAILRADVIWEILYGEPIPLK